MEMRQPLDSRYGYDFVPQKLKFIVNDRSVDRLFVIKEEDSQMNIWKWLEKVLDKLTRETDVMCTETMYQKTLCLMQEMWGGSENVAAYERLTAWFNKTDDFSRHWLDDAEPERWSRKEGD